MTRRGRRRAAATAPLLAVVLAAGAWWWLPPPRPAAAQEAAAPARGQAVFEARCASCHGLEPGRDGMPGPNLAGLPGRRIAGDPAFDYSPALEEARRAEGAWDRDRLDRFLADPQEMFPGLWMGENGVRDPADRAAVVRFLIPGD